MSTAHRNSSLFRRICERPTPWLTGVGAAIVVAVGLTLLNCRGEEIHSDGIRLCAFEPPTSGPGGTQIACYDHGWPHTFLKRVGQGASWSLGTDVVSFDGRLLVLDIALCAATALTIGVLFWVAKRRGRSFLRWRLSELFIGVAIVAVVLSLWKHQESVWSEEQRIVAELPEGCCWVSTPMDRPAWISRLLSERQKLFLDHAKILELPAQSDDTALTSIAYLASGLKCLDRIVLRETQISDAGLQKALASIHAPSIDISDTRVTGAGLGSLPADTLEFLYATRSGFADAGLAALLRQTRIEALDIAKTDVTDAGIRQLIGMKRLRFLDLRDTQVSGAIVEVLERLPSLTMVQLPEDFPISACDRLKKTLPHVQFEFGSTDTPAIAATAPVKLPGDEELFRGIEQMRSGAVDQAIKSFSAAIQLNPSGLVAYQQRGYAWNVRGEWHNAIRDYEHALESAPDDAWTCNALALLLATCEDDDLRDGQRAIQLAMTACLTTEWNNALYIDTLATAHAAIGDFLRAFEYQTKALEKWPADADDKDEALGRLNTYKRCIDEQLLPTDKAATFL